jgi:hypothetical protein
MDSTNEFQVMVYVQENMDNIPFKTLRQGEQELTREEKLVQLQKTLHDDPALFLSKWGRYLSQRTLALFQAIQNNYEVDFYLDSLLYKEEEEQRKFAAASARRPSKQQKSELYTLVQNRRYEFLKRHLRNSDYFSDESIQLRDPILYDQFIGQHIPAREKKEPFANDITLVNRILSNIDRKYVDDHLYQQKIIDEEQMEEEEEEKDESEDEIFEKSTPIVITKSKSEDVDMTDPAANKEKEGEEEEDENDADEEERDMEGLMEFREEQRSELIRLLEEKFLAGKDVSVREYKH